MTAVYPEPLSGDVNPYPTTEPIPYDPEDPVFTDPVVAVPEPEREHLSAEEANARRDEQVEQVAAAAAEVQPGEPPMVTQYKATYE